MPNWKDAMELKKCINHERYERMVYGKHEKTYDFR